MLRRLILITVIVFCYNCNAQEKSLFNIGLGLSFLAAGTQDDHYDNDIWGLPAISIEKPFYLNIHDFNKLSINPGINFSSITDLEDFTALGGSYSHKLTHISLGGFTRILYHDLFKRFENNIINIGGILGTHFITNTSGNYQGTNYCIDETGRSRFCYYEGDIKEKEFDFFSSFYYGYILGWNARIQSDNKITPSFELQYCPNYAKNRRGKKVDLVQLSVLLRMKSKK